MKNEKILKVLVVEDNPGDYVLLTKHLKQTGLALQEVTWVKRLQEIHTLTTKNYDVAFLDLSLPDSSGKDSFVALDSFLPNVPIVVLSGMKDMEAALETIALGVSSDVGVRA